ncbi:MAG: site-specific integrase [Hydrotalea sp.]|nr:site-specific integrase [Hydrotalea sp.]
MSRKISILFYPRKDVFTPNGEIYIYCRVTIASKRAKFSTGVTCLLEYWEPKLKRVHPEAHDAKKHNITLSRIEVQLLEVYERLSLSNDQLTPDLVVDRYQGKKEKAKQILEVFRDHNNRMKALVNVEYSPGTLERYETSLNHTAEFIKWKFKKSDFDIDKLDNNFINDYDFFLRTVKRCSHNTTVKYIKNFSKIVRICSNNGWLEKYPFTNYKQKTKEVERVFLSQNEIDSIYIKDMNNNRLEAVRDIFIFSCYTGLAYIDVQKLTSENIVTGIDGGKWININRQKTDVKSSIPLLPVAEEIINKYEKQFNGLKSDKLLPVLTNQKMNCYLKEIAAICNINKELTFHIARHTFATTVTLTNGVPIESVSKMLGHSSIKMTQHYAKIVDRKLSDDMLQLREKLKKNESISKNKLKAIS